MLVIALQIVWQLLSHKRHSDMHIVRAAAAFEGLVHNGNSSCATGARNAKEPFSENQSAGLRGARVLPLNRAARPQLTAVRACFRDNDPGSPVHP